MGDFTARMADANVKSELDWQLYLLQRRYLDYQVNIGNKMIELLSGDEEQRSLAPSLSLPKRKFQDMIDELFSYTHKTIDRKSNDIVFYQNGERLLPYNPFATIDPGVAKLVEMGVELGHKGNPDLVCGVCGEHGGDPTSVEFCHNVGLDYVSCSPFRVPIARLAAAQAAIKKPRA